VGTKVEESLWNMLRRMAFDVGKSTHELLNEAVKDFIKKSAKGEVQKDIHKKPDTSIRCKSKVKNIQEPPINNPNNTPLTKQPKQAKTPKNYGLTEEQQRLEKINYQGPKLPIQDAPRQPAMGFQQPSNYRYDYEDDNVDSF